MPLEQRRPRKPAPATSEAATEHARLELVLAAAEVGSFDWDISTGGLIWDDRLCRIFGVDPVAFDSHINTFYAHVVAEDLPDVLQAMKSAIDSCGDYEAEYRVRHPDGTVRWVDARGRVFPGADGTAARMLGVARDSTELRNARDTVARTLEHMADAFLKVDLAWRVTYLNRHAEALVGAEHASARGRLLWDVWPALVTAGYDAAFQAAVAQGEPGMLALYDVHTDRWHQLRVVPEVDGVSVFATDVTASRAAEVDRERSVTRPEQARRVLAYSAALAEAVTLADVIDVIATTVLAAFDAAGMIVALVEAGRLRVAGHAGYDDQALELLDGLALDASVPTAQVLRTREPLFLPSRQAYLGLFPNQRVVQASRKHAWAFLPLIVSGRRVGSLTVAFGSPHDFPPEERSLLASVAGLLAQTLERARLRDAERSLAAELQRDLLPRELPQPDGLKATARYLPATDGMEVGGDWYDVLELPDGRVGLVVGDVQGHSVRAAAVMGQLRNALRAYAAEGHDAVTIMSRTNRLMTELATGMFATCCLVVVDPVLERADVVRAGHPPPLRRSAGAGPVSTLDSPAGLPLGIEAEEAYEVVQVPLAVGDIVVLLTDGLVEDPRTPMDVGYARIAGILEEHPWTDLDLLVDALVAAAQVVEHRSDDIAVLVVRHDGIDAAARPLLASKSVDREDPRAARAARDFIAAQLAAWGMDQLEETAVLLVSEVVTNALRHTSGAVTLDLTRLADRILVEVTDDITRTPTHGSGDLLDEGGRGVPLLDVLSDRWGTAPRGTGKVVWFELGTASDARN